MRRLSLQNYETKYKTQYRANGVSQTSFTNRSALLNKPAQLLELSDKHAMIGVALIDLLSMIIPRTIIDATRNGFAATETFIRESSGLLINCMIPSVVVMSAGYLMKKGIMSDKQFNKMPLHKVWADEATANILTNKYEKAYKTAKSNGNEDKLLKDYVNSVVTDIRGLNGRDWKKLENKETINKYTEDLVKAIKSNNSKETSKLLKQATTDISQELGAAKNIKLNSVQNHKTLKQISSTLADHLRDTVHLGKIFETKDEKLVKNVLKKTRVIDDNNIRSFTKKFNNLVNKKSFIGLALISGIGFGMQAINRYITKKRTGVDGFVGYKDYSNSQKHKKTNQEKIDLAFKKLLASGGMLGMAAASMGKITKGKFQFNGIFPTMNQCRVVSATTYTGRIAASDDKNELRESFIRDALGFLNLYVLGDYVAKGVATLMDKKDGKVQGQLVNIKKELTKRPPSENKIAYGAKKFWNWVKNYELKGFEEITDQKLKNKRAIAQASGLVYSMVVLGFIVPILNKRMTEKKEALKANEQNQPINSNSPVKAPPTMTGRNSITPETQQLFSAFLKSKK